MVARLQATTVSCTRVSIYLSIYVDQVGKVSRCSVLGLGGGGGGGGRGERDDERETEPVMGEALRLFVFLFSLLGSLTGGGGGGRGRRSRKKRGIPSMVAKRMMGYRERKRRPAKEQRGGGVSSSQAEDGMRNSRWLSLRCLYTRGSCTAVGHISVSRERGAPPKNQIECKNRINSSRAESRAMSARFAFVQTAPLPSLSLGTGRPLSLSLVRARDLFSLPLCSARTTA